MRNVGFDFFFGNSRMQFLLYIYMCMYIYLYLYLYIYTPTGFLLMAQKR